MPPHTHVRAALGRRLLAVAALGLVASATAGAFARTAGAAAAAPRVGSSLTLAGQTSWVRGPSGLDLQLQVRSSLPVSRLGLRFVLYSRLTSRSAFEQSATGVEPSSELPVDTPPTISLALVDRRPSADGAVTVHFPVTTASSSPSREAASPTLALDCGDQCDGVYPLQAVLVDTTTEALLASFTTHVVYTSGIAGALPLRVSLVLPAGSAVALTSRGAPLLGTRRLVGLASLLGTLAAAPSVAVTLEIYPQLLVALERDPSRQARSVLAAFTSSFGARGGASSPEREILSTTFAPVDVAALSAAHLSGELARQLARGAQAIDSGLGVAAAPTPYVSYAPVGSSALSLLGHDGARELVLPTDAVAPTAGSPAPSVALTSPFGLVPPEARGSSLSAPQSTALVADPALASHFSSSPGDPVLAAHQLLADLAEIYFDAPSDQDARGVVVAPASWTPDRAFLATVLSGLADSPVLTARTLSQAFAQLPVGGNGSPRTEQLASGVVRSAHPLAGGPVTSGRRALLVLASVLPGAKTLLSRLGDSILLSEATGMPVSARRRYAGAPRSSFALIDRPLATTGGRTVTLTSRTGQIPITITSSSPYPVHALLEVRDSALTFPEGGAGPVPVTFATKTTARNYHVSTRTSGASRLDVVVLSPTGGVVLLNSSFTIRSTAVSGVAVTLSIGALLVLLGWWLRSVLRHRRRAAAARALAPGTAETTPGS
ncbi:MAG TPA: hypothetical protein VND23_01270 [Acidimicrobiales bacterium]|nr:hypothetical protein [Acidimicrobiales bacterium]